MFWILLARYCSNRSVLLSKRFNVSSNFSNRLPWPHHTVTNTHRHLSDKLFGNSIVCIQPEASRIVLQNWYDHTHMFRVVLEECRTNDSLLCANGPFMPRNRSYQVWVAAVSFHLVVLSCRTTIISLRKRISLLWPNMSIVITDTLMRFISYFSLICGFVLVKSDICQDYCLNTTSCATDPHPHGSYCKSWQSTPACFGLYWTDSTQTEMCFEPNDQTCSESLPVEC